MPPKRSKRNSLLEKQLEGNEEGTKRLKTKKSVPIIEDNDGQEYLNLLAKFLDDDSSEKVVSVPKKEEKSTLSKKDWTTSKKQSELEQQNECMACLQSQFQGGKYVLECKHVLCNQCYVYWSCVSINCPACAKLSHYVTMVLDGERRTRQLKPKYQSLVCENCKGVNNEKQMYYCDSCEANCVHLYCEPRLLEVVDKEAVWICFQCRRKKPSGKGKEKKGKYKREHQTREATEESNTEQFQIANLGNSRHQGGRGKVKPSTTIRSPWPKRF